VYHVMELVMSHSSPALPPPPARMGGRSVHDEATFVIVCSPPPEHEGTGTDRTGFSTERLYPSACFLT